MPDDVRVASLSSRRCQRRRAAHPRHRMPFATHPHRCFARGDDSTMTRGGGRKGAAWRIAACTTRLAIMHAGLRAAYREKGTQEAAGGTDSGAQPLGTLRSEALARPVLPPSARVPDSGAGVPALLLPAPRSRQPCVTSAVRPQRGRTRDSGEGRVHIVSRGGERAAEGAARARRRIRGGALGFTANNPVYPGARRHPSIAKRSLARGRDALGRLPCSGGRLAYTGALPKSHVHLGGDSVGSAGQRLLQRGGQRAARDARYEPHALPGGAPGTAVSGRGAQTREHGARMNDSDGAQAAKDAP